MQMKCSTRISGKSSSMLNPLYVYIYIYIDIYIYNIYILRGIRQYSPPCSTMFCCQDHFELIWIDDKLCDILDHIAQTFFHYEFQ